MFKKLLSTTPQLSTSSDVPSAPSPWSSPKSAKKSPMKDPEENQDSSPTQVCLTKREKYANVNENDQEDVVPDLILPPSPPSEIALPSKQTNDQIPFSPANNRGHTRDDSLETTISQSMDLSSFIKSFKLQQEEKQQQHLGQDHKKKASEWTFSGCDDSHDGSLSLAASQVDISLANDIATIQVESDSRECESKIEGNSSGSSSKESMNKPKKNNDPKLEVLKEPMDPLAVGNVASHVPSHSRSVKNRSHDPDTMVHVGEQLFRESFKAREEKSIQKISQNTTASDAPEKKASTGKNGVTVMTSMTKFLIFAIVVIAFVFGNEGGIRPDDVSETMAASTVCDATHQKCQESSKFDPQVEGISYSPKIDDDVVLYDSSNHDFEERKIHIDDKLPNSIEPLPNDLIWDDSSNRLYENQTIEKSTESPNSSKASDYESRRGVKFEFLDRIMIFLFVAWPVVVTFMGYRLFPSLLSSSSSLEKKVGMGAKAPSTPTVASLHSRRDSFLTPPLSSKNKAQEPSEWMSPLYGADAIDISVYKSMKHDEIRELLRDRKCDTRGNKEKLIKILIMSYQNELACLTVKQLRPKLRRRKLSQKGNKKDVVRRLVEAGPITPMNKV